MTATSNWVQLQTDVEHYRAPLSQAAETVIDEKVSNYPIFIAYAGDEAEKVPGIFVLDVPTDRDLVWTINVTTLEELVTKQIVTTDRVDSFRKVYRENVDQLCFLIVDEAGARFGFVPTGTSDAKPAAPPSIDA